MKRSAYLVMIVAVCLGIAPGPAAEQSEEEFLPIGLTEEEMQRLDEIGMYHELTAPPSGLIRNCAEWEPSEGVIVRWPLGIPVSLIAEMSEDVVVWTIVASSYQQNQAISSYTSGGVNMDNTGFIVAPTNSIWTRDYGPWFIFQDSLLGIVDHIYNRPRPDDDLIPGVIGDEWGLEVYAMDLVHTGGNHMSDGLGMSMSTRLVYNENPGKTERQVDSIMKAYLGNDYTVLDYVETGGIHHIDCWAKFLDPTTILIKDAPVGDPSHALLDARADFLSQQISAWERPYTIVRVYCPYGTAYTNSLILNGKVLVPIFGSGWDDDALQTYEDAMPGYEVLGFYGSWYDNDAIHCRAMGVPDKRMLFVDHVPLWGVVGPTVGGFPVAARVYAHSGMDLIEESTKVFYSVDGGPFQTVPLSQLPGTDSVFSVIPAQLPGTQVRYYLQAGDLSGRVETHPYIGAPWAHEFSVNASPVITSPDSVFCWGGEAMAYLPEYSDDDDSVHTIAYHDYPLWLTVQNDTLKGTAPEVRELTAFTVEVSDPYSSDSLEVAVFVCLCGDVNDDGEGPNIVDLNHLVAYFFSGGEAPPIMDAADMNGADGIVNIVDLVRLVDYLFGSGPEPVCWQD